MKKTLAFITLCTLLFTGCSQGVSQSEYNTLLAENQALQEEIISLQNEPDMIEVTLTGGFTANVIEVIDGEEFLSSDLNALVLTCYQGGPFVMYYEEGTIENIEIGERYYFTIEDRDIGEFSADEYENGAGDLEVLSAQYNLRVESIREPMEDEWGVECVFLEYKIINTKM